MAPGLRPAAASRSTAATGACCTGRLLDRAVCVAAGVGAGGFGGQDVPQPVGVEGAGDPQVVVAVGAAERRGAQDQVGVVDEPFVDRRRGRRWCRGLRCGARLRRR